MKAYTVNLGKLSVADARLIVAALRQYSHATNKHDIATGAIIGHLADNVNDLVTEATK